MKAVVKVVNPNFGMARAETANDLSDELEVDLERLEVEQEARNLTTGQPVRLKIDPFNVTDMRLPDGQIRLPEPSRRRGER